VQRRETLVLAKQGLHEDGVTYSANQDLAKEER
jgi:hypothetical protein